MRRSLSLYSLFAAAALISGITLPAASAPAGRGPSISPSPGCSAAALSRLGRGRAELVASLRLAQNGNGPLSSRERATRPKAEPGEGESTPAKQYCANIAKAAADARFARQSKILADMAQALEERRAQLEAKIAELRIWIARRDEFSKKAQAIFVGIYARMKPDAAAAQLAEMDEETAAAVLTKLDLRSASAIMNEMEPRKAARLNAVIAGAAKGPDDKSSDNKPGPDGKKS